MLPDGDYDFEVINAADAVSKASGADMIVLDIKVFDGDGGTRNVKDYLVATPGGMRKVRQFAIAVGMLSDYENGDLEAHALHNQSGRCKIGADRSEGYEPKNKVVYYLDPAKAPSAAATVRRAPPVKLPPAKKAWEPAPAGDIDDEIPF